MQAVKVGLVWKTFAMVSSNKSSSKKPRNRKSKEERRAVVESFITKYRNTNDGKFPSLSLTQKEVGGSFYTVREIMNQIMHESTHSSASLLPLEAQSIEKGLSQAEELNIGTFSPTKFNGLGQLQDSFDQDSDNKTLIKSSETLNSGFCEEIFEGVESVSGTFLINSESQIRTEAMHESDHKQGNNLHSEELTEGLIDAVSIEISSIGLEDQKQDEVEGTMPISSIVDNRAKEHAELSSTENVDPIFEHHDELLTSPVDRNVIEYGNLVDRQTVSELVDELPNEKHVTNGSNHGFYQLQEPSPCMDELRTTYLTSDTGIRDEIFVGQISNVISEPNSSSESAAKKHKESEAEESDDQLSEDSLSIASNQEVSVHLSSNSALLANGISSNGGAFIETKKATVHTQASPTVRLEPDNKAEKVSLSPNCKKENTFLENIISENSDSTLSRTSEIYSLPSKLNSPQEDEAVTSYSDESSCKSLEHPMSFSAPEFQLEDGFHSNSDASNKAFKQNQGRADTGFKHKVCAMSGTNVSNMSTADRSPRALVPTLPRRELKAAMKQETNPLWMVMKAFLRAFVKFWTE